MNKNQILKKLKEIKESINEKEVFHELCLLFPFNENLIVDLVSDIEKNGQIAPIVKYNGKILDGRHRWYSCKIIGILPKFVELDIEVNPRIYSESRNLVRRDLTSIQRIEIALKLDNWSPSKIEVSEPENKKTKALEEYRHNKKIATKAKSVPDTVRKVKEIIIRAEELPEVKEAYEKLKKNEIRSVNTVYRKIKEPEKSIKQIKEEKEPIEKKRNKALREKYDALKEDYEILKKKYSFLKEKCEELGIWDTIQKENQEKYIIEIDEPSIKQRRDAELKY